MNIGMLLYILVWLAALIGYVLNIVKVISYAMVGGELSIMFILRIVGIFAAPLGAILGYF